MSAHPNGGRVESRPNVVVFVMDTTRALDTVPADADVSPTRAALADEGTEYGQAFSAAPWTLPSHGSLFTGTYPSKHRANGDRTRLDRELPTVAELFGDAGYETVGVSNNVWITEEFGFSRGFETFHARGGSWQDRETLGDLLRNPSGSDGPGFSFAEALSNCLSSESESERDEGAEKSIEWVREWLRTRNQTRPFFLFVNCIEPHLEYRPPEEYAERFLPEGWSYEEAMAIPQGPREYDVGEFDLSTEELAVLRRLYRAEIAYMDDQLGAVVDALEATGERDETVLAVTSDHGENIGEHGFLGHQYSLYDTVLHVPLVLSGGRFDDGAVTGERLVQTLDLAPTLLDAAGIEAPDAREAFQGRSFHPSADTDPRSKVFAEYAAPRPPIEKLEERFDEIPERIYDLQRSIKAVRTETHKYVRCSDGNEELYDVAADPSETTDISGEATERASDLEAALDSWLASFEQTERTETEEVSVEQSTEQRLADLGYL
ncbi:sulfatase [Haloarcula nitratireducens]|uniref:Sulfatase n=1 Tax=Haloarcula nitratireducens TaxID=2487749 RepID=A0AAW4PGN9_9EURY|nr:sulfatase [Halomicroarcula nitratireducens]MBX0296465.1 sulfatase [Halomicroarcula nitratireducens]